MKDTTTTHVYCVDNMIKDLQGFKKEVISMRHRMANLASVDAVYNDKAAVYIMRQMVALYDDIELYLDYLAKLEDENND